MQNIDLICVGKLNAKYFAEGVAEYQKRLAAFAAFRIIELPEEKIEEKNASDAVVKKALDKEGSERKLWYLFLHKYPVKIYKQRIIGRFIVDFYCLRPDWSLNWMALSIMNLRGLLMMRNVLNS